MTSLQPICFPLCHAVRSLRKSQFTFKDFLHSILPTFPEGKDNLEITKRHYFTIKKTKGERIWGTLYVFMARANPKCSSCIFWWLSSRFYLVTKFKSLLSLAYTIAVAYPLVPLSPVNNPIYCCLSKLIKQKYLLHWNGIIIGLWGLKDIMRIKFLAYVWALSTH